MYMKKLIVSACFLLGCSISFGRESQKEIYVRFPIGNSTLKTAYRDNASRLSEAVTFLKNAQRDSTLELVQVVFSGSASPDGRFAYNRRLAEKRRNALERYIRGQVSLPDSIISRRDGAIAWESLAELVEVSKMPHKEEAIDVLRDIPEFTYNDKGILIDSRKKHLMELRYGRTWNYMHANFFSKIRNAGVILVTVRQKPVTKAEQKAEDAPESSGAKDVKEENPDTVIVVDTVAVDTVATTPASNIENVIRTEKPFYMAVKTNMLYDVLAVPNIGVEFYLGKNWSVSGDWMYGWWKKDSKHRYWRIYGGNISIRKWIGKKADEKPLTGHHLGIYGQAFTYDFEWNGKGYMGGKPGGSLWDKTNYAAGVEYGYSLPITRRLNLDFTLGVGYWGGRYYEYIPLDGHYVWQTTKNRRWIGPTKAEISLVWLIGKGNTNSKKGGAK